MKYDKTARSTVIVILTISVCLLLSACSVLGIESPPKTYSFPNRGEEISQITLLHNCNPNGQGIDEENMRVIRDLTSDEITSFMEDLYGLETKRVGTPPPWGYGRYLVKITYTNGDIEMLGILNIEYIVNGAEVTGYGDYKFKDDGLKNLIIKYAGSELP